MTQRIALLIAAGLTAFCLVVAGGLSMALMQPSAPPVALDAPPPAPAVDLVSSTAGGGAAPALAPEQEAVYQQALQEARAQLDEANRRLAAANEQLRLAQQPPSPTPVPADPPSPTAAQAPAPPVSPDRAALIAQTVAGSAVLNGTPGLVLFQGTAAYEVQFDRGAVYVDAASGGILYNGLAAAVTAPPPAPAPARVQTHEDDEHEGGDD
jgi:hypothetical protein